MIKPLRNEGKRLANTPFSFVSLSFFNVLHRWHFFFFLGELYARLGWQLTILRSDSHPSISARSPCRKLPYGDYLGSDSPAESSPKKKKRPSVQTVKKPLRNKGKRMHTPPFSFVSLSFCDVLFRGPHFFVFFSGKTKKQCPSV